MNEIIVEEQTFADVLKTLMKKYKISGQKIADRIGKSQKTVSRYANGDVVPKKKIQEQVLQAVAEIAGYSTETIIAEGQEIKKVWKLERVTLGSARRDAYRERREQAEQWAVLDGVRRIGNIGAHMEKDINLIVDIEPDEAQKLIKLIELLLQQWYIERHNQQELFADIIGIDQAKQQERKKTE